MLDITYYFRQTTVPGFDMSEFFLRLLVCFVTGNSDMHLKNFSLIERNPGSRDYILSPAYDLLPVNVIMPEDTEETALALNGKKSNLHRKDFLELAKNIGLNERSAKHMIDSVIGKEEDAIALCRDSFLNEKLQKALIMIVRDRCDRLK